MAYFPLFLDMRGVKVLVVGGGKIAAEKIEKLIDFTTEITVIATTLSCQTDALIRKYALSGYQRPYREGDINGYDIVIIATDKAALHKSIYEESRGAHILVNSVDNTQYCDFIFPSYIKQDDLTIAFSTGGASPAFAKRLREYMEHIIPKNAALFLKKMKRLRTTTPKGKERMQHFERMVEAYFQRYFK